jgi:hypothetical protein
LERIVVTVDVGCEENRAADFLADKLGSSPLSAIILMVSPKADFENLAEVFSNRFPKAQVIGCSTAGEICHDGYAEQRILALGLPKTHFSCRVQMVSDVDNADYGKVSTLMLRNKADLEKQHPDWENEFNFLLIDGLSQCEDKFVSALSMALGSVPLFGGSSADGVEFTKTKILHQGTWQENAAVLMQVRTRCGISVFKTDHLIPTEKRMVVTKANPEERTVSEINAAPAAKEYARLLGKDPKQLSTFTFAAHPVVVKVGGTHHVRAIQRISENGDLIFFSAIDEGLVLTLADPMDMSDHLEKEMAKLSQERAPDIVLACDCILRRLEAQEKQKSRALSQIMSDNRVFGFSTYGEQYNSMHVNQTLTGVAIYPPEAGE